MSENPFDQILKFFVNLDLWQIVKFVFLFGVVLYLVFAVVVIRQVKLMLDSLEIELEFLIRLIAWLYLFLVIGVFIIGIIYL